VHILKHTFKYVHTYVHTIIMVDKEDGGAEEFEKISIKRIKGSRKSKKSWRKHGDIADIEQYLDNERQDQRTGGKLDDKPNDALFMMDTNANEKTLGKKKVSRKPRVDGGIEVDEDDDEEYIPRKKRLEKKLSTEAAMLKQKAVELRGVKVHTIWGQEVMAIAEDNNAYIDHALKKEKVRPNTVNVGKSETVGALELPAGGASYNPSYDSHQQLLLKAHLEEVRKLKERNKWSSKVKMVSVKELKKRAKMHRKEMAEGLGGEEEDAEVDTNTEKPDFAPAPVSAENRKTLQKRRRESLIRKAKQLKLAQKRSRIRANDILRLKTLKKEIKRIQNKSADTKEKREALEQDNEGKTKRLGKYKFKEGDTVVLPSDELSGTLRELRPDGNLLKDSFCSLQRRNIIEPRNRVLPHTKYKRKVVVKRSYKNSLVQGSKSHR